MCPECGTAKTCRACKADAKRAEAQLPPPPPTYCAEFLEWQATDRKTPPPCRSCSVAASTRARAVQYRKAATAMDNYTNKVLKEHP